jgi:hypothetical protein
LSDREPGYIGLVVLVEACWVLGRLYGATPADLRDTVCDLLDTRQIVVERRAVVAAALARLGASLIGPATSRMHWWLKAHRRPVAHEASPSTRLPSSSAWSCCAERGAADDNRGAGARLRPTLIACCHQLRKANDELR